MVSVGLFIGLQSVLRCHFAAVFQPHIQLLPYTLLHMITQKSHQQQTSTSIAVTLIMQLNDYNTNTL